MQYLTLAKTVNMYHHLSFNSCVPDEPGLADFPRQFSSSTCSSTEPLDSGQVAQGGTGQCPYNQPTKGIKAVKATENTDPQPVAWSRPFSIHQWIPVDEALLPVTVDMVTIC